MKLPVGLKGVAGGVIMPANVSYHTLTRRKKIEKEHPHLKRRLLDPQIYLAELNASPCRTACAYLASYGWFPLAEHLPFSSSEQKQSEWRQHVADNIEKIWTARTPTTDEEIEDAVRVCLTVQKQLGVEALILPAPLTSDVNTAFTVELKWLERGLELAKAIAPDLPTYASVAISDVVLRAGDPWANSLVGVVLDQLTARKITGTYIVPVMASEDSYYYTHPHAVGSLLRLCNGLKGGGVGRVMVSFAGTAGLLCLAAGADAWTTGWFKSQRRMRLSDFQDHEGRVVPAYYSHGSGGEFHMESDLDRAVVKGFLPRIRDLTRASAGLLKAFDAGKHSNTVPEWQYRLGNKTASIEHFLEACVRETHKLAGLSDADAQVALKEWTASAFAVASDLQKQVGGLDQRTAVSHQHGWMKAFEQLTQNKY